MSEYIHKSHNVSVLLYHAVCPTKYRRAVVTDEVDVVLRRVCVDISNRYEITFLEIGTDQDHVHFLLQSVPMHSPKKIVQTIKRITAREILRRVPRDTAACAVGEGAALGRRLLALGRLLHKHSWSKRHGRRDPSLRCEPGARSRVP